MAPATDSLQRRTPIPVTARGNGEHGGMGSIGGAKRGRDERRRKGKSRDEVSSTAPWVYPPALLRDSYEFRRVPAILPGITLATVAPLAATSY